MCVRARAGARAGARARARARARVCVTAVLRSTGLLCERLSWIRVIPDM